ncbi:MAG: hypothetical protein HQL88_03450, partial [Magnetococcales bacterium]|nr:hypothetical protein [Magnetococcales bacterium]
MGPGCHACAGTRNVVNGTDGHGTMEEELDKNRSQYDTTLKDLFGQPP